ncbi:MAG: methionine adenosyltransferase domain-containing protein [Candidatus Doudnabacteria bacterium]|nr:methionine adenosyltransferase domain-containing protein [Candidatus Doudnabacteria bacterium]
MLKTAEFVSPRHPDKICDFIADSILDLFLIQDPNSRVAVEVMGGHGHITVSGEITTSADVNIEKIVKEIVGNTFGVSVYATKQSPQIAQGVDVGGAGDQGIMVGYACTDSANLMPLEYELARNLCHKVFDVYPFDGKVQVTVDDQAIKTVVVSFQNTKTTELEKLVRSIIQAEEYLINPAGEWTIGGFDADSGLSGRKLVIDAYGPSVSVGGGSFSGKDYTKVDRSGAYMARKIAVDLLKQHQASEVRVKLAYAIGKPLPVMAVATIDGKPVVVQNYDLTPAGIRKLLQLDQPIYVATANWGHFGRGFIWDI